MIENRIDIDEPALRREVLAYLRTADGEPVLQKFAWTFIVTLAFAIIMTVVGVCMLPTVVLTLLGLRILRNVFTFLPFQLRLCSRNYGRNPELLVPLVAHGIIIGPDQKHALVLGTFRSPAEYSSDRLARKAAFLASVYAMPSETCPPEHAALHKLLRDDRYQACRRRCLPEPYSEGLELVLFDVIVDPAGGRDTPYDTVLFAFVAEHDPGKADGGKGWIEAIPWQVVDEAVTVRD